jgi:hypothetical protein
MERVLDVFSKYYMNILLDLNAKVSKEEIFEPIIRIESFQENSNDNGVTD